MVCLSVRFSQKLEVSGVAARITISCSGIDIYTIFQETERGLHGVALLLQSRPCHTSEERAGTIYAHHLQAVPPDAHHHVVPPLAILVQVLLDTLVCLISILRQWLEKILTMSAKATVRACIACPLNKKKFL